MNWLRNAATAALVLVLALAAVTLRALAAGEDEMTQSDRAFNEGDLRGAIFHARRAAISYAPGAPHVRAAFDRLEAIGLGAEAAGKLETAKHAWQAVRAATLETRHVWVPEGQRLALANRNLARLEAAELERHPPATGAVTTPAARERALRDLAADDSRVPWTIALAAGVLCCVLGLSLVVLRGMDPAGRVSIKASRLGLILTALGAACWTIAIWRA